MFYIIVSSYLHLLLKKWVSLLAQTVKSATGLILGLKFPGERAWLLMHMVLPGELHGQGGG